MKKGYIFGVDEDLELDLQENSILGRKSTKIILLIIVLALIALVIGFMLIRRNIFSPDQMSPTPQQTNIEDENSSPTPTGSTTTGKPTSSPTPTSTKDVGDLQANPTKTPTPTQGFGLTN